MLDAGEGNLDFAVAFDLIVSSDQHFFQNREENVLTFMSGSIIINMSSILLSCCKQERQTIYYVYFASLSLEELKRKHRLMVLDIYNKGQLRPNHTRPIQGIVFQEVIFIIGLISSSQEWN